MTEIVELIVSGVLTVVVMWSFWASKKLVAQGERIAQVDAEMKTLLTKVEFLEAQAEFKSEIFAKIDGLSNGNK